MSPGLAVIGVAVVAGAVVAVSAHESRAAILGLVLVLVTAPLLSTGAHLLLPLAGRLVGAILAGYLLWVSVRSAPPATASSHLGWPAEALLAACAATIGWGAAEALGAAAGPREAVAASAALAVLAVGPLARNDALQLGVGAILGLTAAALLHVGLVGAPSPLEQLGVAAAVVAAAAAAALLARAATEAAGSLDVAPRPAPAARPAPEPPTERRRPAVVARARR